MTAAPPLRKQYLDIKRRHRDAILGEDASHAYLATDQPDCH
jgi:hypothetical protein